MNIMDYIGLYRMMQDYIGFYRTCIRLQDLYTITKDSVGLYVIIQDYQDYIGLYMTMIVGKWEFTW